MIFLKEIDLIFSNLLMKKNFHLNMTKSKNSGKNSGTRLQQNKIEFFNSFLYYFIQKSLKIVPGHGQKEQNRCQQANRE